MSLFKSVIKRRRRESWDAFPPQWMLLGCWSRLGSLFGWYYPQLVIGILLFSDIHRLSLDYITSKLAVSRLGTVLIIIRWVHKDALWYIITHLDIGVLHSGTFITFILGGEEW